MERQKINSSISIFHFLVRYYARKAKSPESCTPGLLLMILKGKSTLLLNVVYHVLSHSANNFDGLLIFRHTLGSE